MGEEVKIQSKILVHEADPTVMKDFKDFFSSHNLIGLNAIDSGTLFDAIRSNIDLGAIILNEEEDNSGNNGIELARAIHKIRQELPIFLRRKGKNNLDDLSSDAQSSIAAAFSNENIQELIELVEKFIFNTDYPNAMIRGIQEISTESIKAIFKNVDVACSAPYLVNDRLIFGELFTLMPLEGSWARGYVMFQTEEQAMLKLIEAGRTSLPTENQNFMAVNSALGELTNLVWGGFKSRFFLDEPPADRARQTQVPIIVNHEHKYVTFGSMDPQLCFRYHLTDQEGVLPPITIYQKYIFNLFWSPESFQEKTEIVDDMVASGELELF